MKVGRMSDLSLLILLLRDPSRQNDPLTMDRPQKSKMRAPAHRLNYLTSPHFRTRVPKTTEEKAKQLITVIDHHNNINIIHCTLLHGAAPDGADSPTVTVFTCCSSSSSD